MPEKRVRLIEEPWDMTSALQVREVVFIQGQGVPRELEVDGLDPQCTHFLAEVLQDERWVPVGTARLHQVGEAAKAERVAVLDAWRGYGLGAALMEALEAAARERGFAEVILNAQVQVVPFYEHLGYEAEGPEFDEAGILHRAMRRRL